MCVQQENILTKWGSPKYVLAPMVDASELAWRMLARRYGVQLTYTPMINAGMFLKDKKYRKSCLQFSDEDRPLIAQFCANTPESFVQAAQALQPFCDAVDLNLGCPQGIARRGHYGAFLQDEWDLLTRIISQAVKKLKVPVTCKIRIFSDVERTVSYAKMLEAAGASLLVIHGRTREMKGHSTGLADWSQIKRVKAELHIPVIANGNIQYLSDVTRCLSETNVNAVMSAEGHLHNPAIFVGSQPSVYSMCLEYLECAKTYPTSISIVRGHVFKLSHHALNEHPSFRQLIGLAQDTDELSDVIRQMQKTCSECSQNRDISLQYPHWICQPYERPKSEHSLAADRQFGADPENTGELSCTPEDPLSCKLILQEERRSRRDAKQKAKAAKRVAARSKNSLCNRCQSNLRGAQCPSMACRSCCWTLDPKRVSQCAAHLHDKRRRTCEQ